MGAPRCCCLVMLSFPALAAGADSIAPALDACLAEPEGSSTSGWPSAPATRSGTSAMATSQTVRTPGNGRARAGCARPRDDAAAARAIARCEGLGLDCGPGDETKR